MTTDVAFKQRLLTPGPTAVPPQVLEEMAKPIIHHRTKAFQAIFAELSELLQRLFVTSGPVLSIAGSGTTAYEAAQVSLIRPGSKALTIAGGKFGERWQDIYDAYAPSLGIEQVRINTPWGHAADVDQIEQALKEHPEISVVTVVHSETSTATCSDVRRIAELVQKTDALLIVDGITSVGAMPVEQDAWGIDVLVTGSQKAMMLPPGLGFVGLGERALRRLEEVQPGPYYNLDLRKWVKSHAKNDVPFTPPVSLIRAQKVACAMILSDGLEAVHKRTRGLAEASRAAFKALGLDLVSHSPSDSVSGAYYPEGVSDSELRAAVRDGHGVHIAGGQDGRGDKWKGRIFRISHMGYVDAEDTRVALGAIETELAALSDSFNPEPGVAVRTFDATLGG
ncbi:pyridoxal-phosphate-dependent aminotransferase family protein [Mucisphaera calidilacus]|uniref:Soluble hydrogenase 42 kDa subunit n=1 Tax=Mucisphaera calidilacus TaxID=2527982 RepID=A0A518BZK7_9BACT|nr:alanine--glyoxylate aminotransferase family protein [Mucisphaera calidilacus]QDU72399.1 Soluble hydrogenase 42 kDa subunit [Mucisphaera calidilacus]